MRSTVTLTAKAQQDPFVMIPALAGTGSTGARTIIRAFIRILQNLIGPGFFGRFAQRPQLRVSTAGAQGTVTFLVAVAGNTITINGQALTATQQNASGTVTCATVLAGDTATINGTVFTAVSGTAAANQFDISGGNTTGAASLAASIMAAQALGNDTNLTNIGAKSAAAVVTVFYRSPGTGGNAATLVSSDGATLAVSGATLANGAAAANNQFDFAQTDALNATQLCGQINGGTITTAIVLDHVVANNRSGIATCLNLVAGDYVVLNGVKLVAGVTATDSGGARITTSPPNVWCMNSSDTDDATSLVNCINAHPRLRELYFASSSVGAVTIRERYPSQGGESSLTSNNNTRLAVTGTTATVMNSVSGVLLEAKASGVSGNAITLASSGSTLAVSGTRLTGGATSTFTF